MNEVYARTLGLATMIRTQVPEVRFSRSAV